MSLVGCRFKNIKVIKGILGVFGGKLNVVWILEDGVVLMSMFLGLLIVLW